MFFLIWVNHLFLALKMTFCYRICCFCGNNLYISFFSLCYVCNKIGLPVRWGGELFLPLYLAAVESHLLGFIRTKGEIDGFALITNLAFGVLQSQVDGDDVAALTGKAPGRNLLQLYTHYIINRQISNAQRNQKYTFPIKTRGENYTFSMKIGVGNQTFPKKAVF